MPCLLDRLSLKKIFFVSSSLLVLFGVTVVVTKPVFAQYSDDTNVEATVSDDHDGDGMPSWWEILHGLDHVDPADANFDPDLDELINLLEYLHGTDPHNPDTDGGTLEDGKEVQQGKNPLDPSDDVFVPDDFGATRAQPQVSLDKRADRDGDGLSDIRERRFGTNPREKDTDNDGIGDYHELLTFFTDPLNWDTDADGLLDGQEVYDFGTDPLRADSDYDRLTDGQEVKVFGTSPTLADTDGGGIPDGDEVINNETDPLDASDDINVDFVFTVNDLGVEDLGLVDENKIDLYTKVKFTLSIVDNNEISIVSGYDVLFETGKKLGMDPVSEIELITPENPSTYDLVILIKTIDGEIVRITKQISVRHRGRVFGQVEGLFGGFFRKVGIGEYGALKNIELSLEKYNESVDRWSMYAPEELKQDNPYMSLDGRYAFVVKPGLYRVRVDRKFAFINEVFVDADAPMLFSKDVYVTYNYDKAGWALLFAATFHIVYGSYIIGRNNKHYFEKLLKLLSRHKNLKSHR